MKLIATLVAAALLAAPTLAAPCRDAKGKFVKCPTATTSAGMDIKKDAKGKCHWVSGPQKGKFTECP